MQHDRTARRQPIRPKLTVQGPRKYSYLIGLLITKPQESCRVFGWAAA